MYVSKERDVPSKFPPVIRALKPAILLAVYLENFTVKIDT